MTGTEYIHRLHPPPKKTTTNALVLAYSLDLSACIVSSFTQTNQLVGSNPNQSPSISNSNLRGQTLKLWSLCI